MILEGLTSRRCTLSATIMFHLVLFQRYAQNFAPKQLAKLSKGFLVRNTGH